MTSVAIPKTEGEIIAEIKAYMAPYGGYYRDWYVGIASDPEKRLFFDHLVRKESDAWVYRNAGTALAARNIEKHFIDQLGCDGGPGGGDQTSHYVYAYRKAGHTEP